MSDVVSILLAPVLASTFPGASFRLGQPGRFLKFASMGNKAMTAWASRLTLPLSYCSSQISCTNVKNKGQYDEWKATEDIVRLWLLEWGLM